MKNNIMLINYPFTKNDNKAFFIENDLNRFNYFKSLNPFSVNDVNFLINDGINSKVQNVAFKTANFYELSKYNYCVYYKTDDNNNPIIESVRYYFANIKQGGGQLYQIDLELDDVNTNYFKNRNKIYGLINKAHINRFKKVGNKYQYNINEDSGFINQSNTYNTNKYLKRTYKLKSNDYNDLYTWLSEHVKYWVVCMLSEGFYNVLQPMQTTLNLAPVLPLIYDSYSCPYGIIYFPVLDDGYKIKCEYFINGQARLIDIDGDAFTEFAKLDGNSPKFYNILYTHDILYNELFALKRLDDNNKTLILNAKGDETLPLLGLYSSMSELSTTTAVVLSTTTKGLFTGLKLKDSINYTSSELNAYICENYTFTKDFIKLNSNNLSPLLASNCSIELRLNSDGSDYYNYDLSLMLTNDEVKDISFKNTFALDTSGTTNYMRLGENYGLYNVNYVNSQIGLCESKIVSIPWANDKFSEYVANNKNYMFTSMSNIIAGNVNRGLSTIGGMTSVGANGLQLNPINPVSIASSLLSSAVNTGLNIANLHASFDNMRASKNSLFANSTSYFYKLQKDKHGYFVDLYTLTDYDKNKMLNDIKVNGYNVDKLDFVYNFDNVRKYYNHISAVIDEIDDDSLSMQEKERLIDKLKDFTFIDILADLSALYNNNNYERYLDE